MPALVRSEDLLCVVSISGGKDSAATALALREAGVPFRMVTADTVWEAPGWSEYLDHLREKLGPIDAVGHPGGMVALARKKAGFPMRKGRWCTEFLKMRPLRAYHDALTATEGVETCSVVGIRAEETAERAAMPLFEDVPEKTADGHPLWGGYVWRPIRDWPVSDVIAIHHRHDVRVNPLYRAGHNRVGCYPCILANKEEIRLVAQNAPERIAQIRELEEEFSRERERRNATGEGNFKHVKATFFSAKDAFGPRGIDDVVAWSRTERGGRSLPLLEPAPSGGCFRWGFCEPPDGGSR